MPWPPPSVVHSSPRPPKPDTHSQQPPKCPAVCRPRHQASPAAPRLPSLQQNYSPGADRVVGCPFPAGRLQPASNGLGLRPPQGSRIPQDHRVRRRHSLQPRASTSPSPGPHLPGAVRSLRPPPSLGSSAWLPGLRYQPQSSPLLRGPQTWGRSRAPEGQAARKVSVKWHLELAASQRSFT